ncbi:ATP phosphoribosyltransferase [Virgibacillus sp. W0430]|uniref:ATP phosphoribosyltransferase n=1 Tax=Virgibacillus sp. W0430 TaxID=3391580 RepID=UPI003F44A5D2
MITLALAKGRTAKDTFRLLEKAKIHFPDFHEKSRKLVFYNENQTIKLIFVKAVDVTTYVEKGAADIGIVGKDNILEAQADIYELLDLNIGKCKFAVASLEDNSISYTSPLTVATKYPNVAQTFFNRKGITIDAIKLNGSVELAPLIGMADVIVDIVETGSTLKENGLSTIEDIEEISTRLVVNKASFATKTSQIQQFITQIKSVLE